MLPSKIKQIMVSQERERESNFGFGHTLMSFFLGMCPPNAAFISFFLW